MKVTLAITIVVSSLAFINIKGLQIEQHTNKVQATNGRRLSEKMSMPHAAKSGKAKSVKSATGDAKAGKESSVGPLSMPDAKSSKVYKTKSSKAKSVKGESKMSRSAKALKGPKAPKGDTLP